MVLMPESRSKNKSSWIQRSETLCESGLLPVIPSTRANQASDTSIASSSLTGKELCENTESQLSTLLSCEAMHPYSLDSMLVELTLHQATIESSRPTTEVTEIFEANPLLPGIILTEQGEFRGMISRRQFFELMSRPYNLELFSKCPLSGFYGCVQTDMLVFPGHTPIVRVVEQSLQRSLELIYEPIVVQIELNDYRLLNVHDLLLAQVQIHQLTANTLRESETKLKQKATQLEQTLYELQQTQTQLIHSEKMSSLGQLITGVAYDITNPINFIYGNLEHASQYTQDMLHLLHLYEQRYPVPAKEIEDEIEAVDLEFIRIDLPKLLSSMQLGANRICEVVRSLRNFLQVDEVHMQPVNVHNGLESTLRLLQSRLRAQTKHSGITVHREYGDLPLVECYAGQLNQVFMNILNNAIDAVEEATIERLLTADASPAIWIRTQELESGHVAIQITDNGSGMSQETYHQLFNPFFTTKAVGKGSGLGLSVSQEIIVGMHNGQLRCSSTLGKGSEFVIEMPIRQSSATSGVSQYSWPHNGFTGTPLSRLMPLKLLES